MFLVLFVDGVEVAQATGGGIEGTQGIVHIGEVVAGEPSYSLCITSDIVWLEEGAVGIELHLKFYTLL